MFKRTKPRLRSSLRALIVATLVLSVLSPLGSAPAFGAGGCPTWQYLERWASSQQGPQTGAAVRGTSKVRFRMKGGYGAGLDRDCRGPVIQAAVGMQLVDSAGLAVNRFLFIGQQTSYEAGPDTVSQAVTYGIWGLRGKWDQSSNMYVPANSTSDDEYFRDSGSAQWLYWFDDAMCTYRITHTGGGTWVAAVRCGDREWEPLKSWDTPYTQGIPMVSLMRRGGVETDLNERWMSLDIYKNGSWAGWINNRCVKDTVTDWDGVKDFDWEFHTNQVRADNTPTC